MKRGWCLPSGFHQQDQRKKALTLGVSCFFSAFRHVLSDFFQILEISPVPQRQALASQIKEQLIFDPEQKYTHVIADQHEGIATTPATTMRLIALALDLLGVPFTAAQWRSIVA